MSMPMTKHSMTKLSVTKLSVTQSPLIAIKRTCPIAASAAVVAGCLSAIAPAAAQMPTWVGFGGQEPPAAAARVEIDRNFVKEWESSPPKGYPTLSKQNLSAMTTAIKLYESVVRQGGFPVIADDQQISVGLFSPVVAQVKKCVANWCRVIGTGFDGWIEQQRLWGVYADEKVD